MYYDEKLKELRDKQARHSSISVKIKALERRCEALREKERELGYIMRREQEDLNKWEGHSLSSLFYLLIGKREERLEKEKREAYEAAVKYESVANELKQLEEEMLMLRLEYQSYPEIENNIKQVLAERGEWLKIHVPKKAEEIKIMEDEIARLERQQKEISEALAAGRRAKEIAISINDDLDSAQNWGTWDLIGGGLGSDLAKHSHLDNAQNNINLLQVQLSKFKTELADIEIHANVQVEIDGFLRFADYFWDGLFADWTVLNKINQSKSSMDEVTEKIMYVLNQLEKLEKVAITECKNKRAELDAFLEAGL